MTDFVYATSGSENDRGNLPDLAVINMFAQNTPTEQKPILVSRPGLETVDIVMGAGPIRGLYQIDGVLNNGLFGVSGTHLYRNSSNLGSIDGTSRVTFAGYQDLLFVNAGQQIWQYNGTTLSAVAFPDNAFVRSMTIGAGRILGIRDDTEAFYWSDPLTSTIDGLNFASAEQSPDKLKDLLFFGDRLALFGSETVEFWQINDDPNLPFAPTLGLTFPVGIKATGSVTIFGDTFAWVTNKNQVCVGDPKQIISYPGLQKKISESSTAFLWEFELDGVRHLCLTLQDSTWAYREGENTWTKLETYGAGNWAANCYCHQYFGSSIDGNLYQWSAGYSDLGGVLERRFRAWMPIDSGAVKFDSIILRTNPGMTEVLTGAYSDPVVEMRLSRDGGRTWNAWKSRHLGYQGQYRKQTRWNTMGIQSYPGAMAEFRVTDPIPFRVSGLVLNEPYGGR